MSRRRAAERRFLLGGFVVSLGAFGACCYPVDAWHAEISTSTIGTYGLLAVTAVSGLAWPIFAVRLIAAAIKWALQRIRGRRGT
jgi:small neutral amino acid transporter SnatA (MarC family)